MSSLYIQWELVVGFVLIIPAAAFALCMLLGPLIAYLSTRHRYHEGRERTRRVLVIYYSIMVACVVVPVIAVALPEFRSIQPITMVIDGIAFAAAVLLVLFATIFGLAVTIDIYLRAREYERGVCKRCGYNLTGNVSGVCPECGTRITDSDSPIESD